MSKEKYIKSPLNYTGGKYKLLPKILPLFPKNINTFVDLFCGGLNVSVNVNANNYIANDFNKQVISLYKWFVSKDKDIIFNEILNKSNEYKLQDKVKENYLSLRKDYNTNKTDLLFYLLITSSFSNQIRFNKKNEFNLPFGDRYFNPSMQENLKHFLVRLERININFINEDFRKLNLDSLDKDDFVYLDPPYLITTATYNENGGWTDKDEIDLLKLLDKLNERGVKFALSNVVIHKGKVNNILLDWINRNNYNVEHLGNNYKNCNYHDSTGINGDSDEVLVMNY